MNRAGDDGIENPPIADVRPLVANDTGNRPLWFGVGGIVLAGLALFFILEGRRETVSAPTISPRVADLAAAPSALPPLYIPPEPAIVSPVLRPQPVKLNPIEDAQRLRQPQFQPPQITQFPPTRIAPDFTPAPPPQPLVPPKPAGDSSPAIVFDQTVGDEGGARVAGSPVSPSVAAAPVAAIATRARAGRARDRATVISQGTLIAAVLETALDSTQPGQTRALVSRDVPNLAGPVLIPRGSRLYGEYKGQLGPGQKRAMVQWTRLETPDGVTIAIDSPAADQLGRAGIKGTVNSQFISRFGGALLQSVIDIGAIAAVGGISNSRFFVPVPGAIQGSTSQFIGQPQKPTLKVKQGTRISVFVARDLDFSAVAPRR
jgi:type IV secretion system protein VirB10